MQKEIRLIKKLPQIVIPSDKNYIFIEWYNKDLRFLDEIPKVFERGYVFLENNFSNDIITESRKRISSIAKATKSTYRKIENKFKDFFEATKNTIIYFEFDSECLKLEIYLNKALCNSLTVNLKIIDNTKPNPMLSEKVKEMINENKELSDIYTYECFVLFQASMWYLATTTKTTKYYREDKIKPYYYEKKEVIKPKKNKVISTPIYDISKIKRVKIDSLIKRRKGWTYSHSFQVHGHYRHYSNGNTIFIKPFIKGKGKEEILQKIILKPKEEV